MNPTAIYSKSGKGVQEAAGKTSLLKRPDRAVLAAIDGRATLADVAQKVGRPFDASFRSIISQLDGAGFIREVSAGTAVAAAAASPGPAARPAPARPAAKPAPPADPASDLDFSQLGKPSMPPRDQESALFKARQEAEAKAKADRERQKVQSEARLRAETEARIRAEAEKKVRAETQKLLREEIEAKARAQAEAKAKAEAEAKRAREEAERIRKEAQEQAERARKEAEEKARREAEELRRRLEEERKAREEAERKAREEAERIRKEAEEQARRAREEAERKAREEAERLRQQLEAERKAREEAERKARAEAERKAREDEERKARAEAERRAREEAERRAQEEAQAAAVPPEAPPEPLAPAAASEPVVEAKLEGFADSLMADLESFSSHEEREAKAREEAARKAKELAERRAREEAERQAAEEEKRRRREEKERRRREEEERLAREDEERKARFRAEEERREREAAERRRKAMEEEALARKAASSTPVEPWDAADARRRSFSRGRDPSVVRAGRRKSGRWGRRLALTLLLLVAIAAAAAHFVPISTTAYQRAAAEALGRPVRIAKARIWLLQGLQLRLDGVSVGEVKIARVMASPKLTALFGERRAFSRIELEGIQLPQESLGEALLARLGSERFSVERIVAKQLSLPGPLLLPADLEADVLLDAQGALRSATVRGPEGLVARLAPKARSIQFEVHAGSFTLPIAPEISLSQFAMEGVADRQGMQIAEWDGAVLNGTVSGTAKVRWGRTWSVDGVITARGINAAVFAPALLSEGNAQGTGKFSASGSDPAKLGSLGHIEGRFTILKGVLGSFDLSRAIQTDGKSPQGRTHFAEMTGHAVYSRGTVSLRNVTIGAGALSAGASADIAQNGALSGRIVADVRTAAETLRATLSLGGTLKEPQVRN